MKTTLITGGTAQSRKLKAKELIGTNYFKACVYDSPKEFLKDMNKEPVKKTTKYIVFTECARPDVVWLMNIISRPDLYCGDFTIKPEIIITSQALTAIDFLPNIVKEIKI